MFSSFVLFADQFLLANLLLQPFSFDSDVYTKLYISLLIYLSSSSKVLILSYSFFYNRQANSVLLFLFSSLHNHSFAIYICLLLYSSLPSNFSRVLRELLFGRFMTFWRFQRKDTPKALHFTNVTSTFKHQERILMNPALNLKVDDRVALLKSTLKVHTPIG